MAVMSERTWNRHSNPWSGWTRAGSFPLLFVPPWTRRWWLGAPLALWLWLNPRLFAAPKDDRAWMTRGVLGEKLWTEGGHRGGLEMRLGILSGLADAAAFALAYRRRFWPMAGFGLAGWLLKMWFIDRMVGLYDARRSSSNTLE
jgi:hypothetical protein